MKKYKEITKTEEVVNAVICDRCKIELSEDMYDYGSFPYYTIDYTGGYNSEWPGDLQRIQIDLCEDCLKELVGNLAEVKYRTEFKNN